MAGTVTGTIGGNAGVFFEYQGTGAALHLDIGFVPSWVEFRTSSLSWVWSATQAVADLSTINGIVAGAAGVGQGIGTVQSVASIQGIQVATDVSMNSNVRYRGICFR